MLARFLPGRLNAGNIKGFSWQALRWKQLASLPGRLKVGTIALLDAVITHTSSAHAVITHAVHVGGCALLTNVLPTSCEQMAALMSTMIILTCMWSNL